MNVRTSFQIQMKSKVEYHVRQQSSHLTIDYYLSAIDGMMSCLTTLTTSAAGNVYQKRKRKKNDVVKNQSGSRKLEHLSPSFVRAFRDGAATAAAATTAATVTAAGNNAIYRGEVIT